MFGKKKESHDGRQPAEAPREPAPAPKGYTAGKGTPTPRRKDVEARNRRPIVADKARMSKEERKALRSEQRTRSNEAWQKGQAAMRSGDERHMPPAHAGPVRRFGRDMIDSRFSLASLFMPLALVLFVAMLLQSRFPALALAILLGTYVLFVIMVIDTGLAVHRTRILAQHKFGEDRVPRGFSTQLFSRSFYIRPWRMPRAQVRLGETPSGGTREDYRQARAARAGRGKG